MKYTYAYKTSDGVRHESTIHASTRDDVFVRLRQQGIKPIKVVAADGSKANGEIRGVRKRMLFLAVTLTALVVAGLAWRITTTFVRPSGLGIELAALDSTMRRQIIGDSAVISKGCRSGWNEVFSLPGERYLASFAIPGNPSSAIKVSEAELRAALDVKTSVPPSKSHVLEFRQIVAMVEGMKAELRKYLADGGHAKVYCERLVQRQMQELSYYGRAKNEIDLAVRNKMPEKQLIELWERRNSDLRQMGIRLIPLPE